MAESTEVNSLQGEVDIVNQISNSDRASAIDAIHDMLFAKASDAMADYKKVVANSFLMNPQKQKRK